MGRFERFRKTHPVIAVVGVLTVVLSGCAAGTAWWVWQETQVPYVEVRFVVPSAPQLAVSGPSQTLHRIDASRSSVTYEVEEILAGTSHTATGSTSGIAGDIVVDDGDPQATRVGQIVVDVQQLTSDQTLRDQRLQHDFLEAQRYPLATFDTETVTGLPDQIVDGTDYQVELAGQLTVKETTSPTTLRGTARRDGDELHLRAEANVKMSTFDIGPISLIGLVKTGDDVVLRFDIVALDAAQLEVPTSIDAPRRDRTVGEGPSFAGTIQPILEQRCAACHNAEGVGSDVWSLETAADAAEVAPGLGLVTETRFMPPWPASEVGIPMQHSTKLTDEQVASIAAWADAGGPLDVDPDTPVVAVAAAVEPLRADLDLPLAVPYQGSPARRNDYRCMILDPQLTDTTFVSGVAFEPDQTEIVHHALAFRVRAAGVASLGELDAGDEGPGWECYAGTGASSADPGADEITTQFMAWAPGQSATRYPEGTGMRMDAGDVFVVQIHYHYAHSSPPDQSRLVVETAEGDEQSIEEIEYGVYLAPAEIPCTAAAQGPLCDRATALVELNKSYGVLASVIANGLHRSCGTRPEDFASMTSGVASASCDHTLFAGGEVLGVFGHMHEIGQSFRMTLNPGTPDETVLLDIPRWDFGWQFNYEPVDPVFLSPGDVIRVECTWDRGLMRVPEARYVTWAEGTEDEMCYSTLTTRPRR